MNKKMIIGIIIVLLIIVIEVVIAYKLIENNVTNREDFKFKVENISSGTVNTVSKEQNGTEKEIVQRLYLEKLKETYFGECRIDNIKITKLNNVQKLYPNATSEAIFAFVTYSVKDKDAIAGNGHVSGNWVIDKSACVYVDKDNGEYKIISSGTGW